MENNIVEKGNNIPDEFLDIYINKNGIVEFFGKNKTGQLLLKLEDLVKRIQDTKNKILKAQYKPTKVNWFQRQFNKIPLIGDLVDSDADLLRKRQDDMLNLDEEQLHISEELNNIIEEVIKFGCATFESASFMNNILAQLLEQGAIKTDGKIIRLSKATKERLEEIKIRTQKFIEEHNRNQEHIEQHRAEIETLRSELKDKENIDNAQEQEIKNLKTKIEILQEQINKKSSFVPYLISALSLIVAIVSLVLNFIDFKN